MIGSGSTLQVSDNSGARVVECIEQSGRSWGVGDTITVAVKKAIKGKAAAGTVSYLLQTKSSREPVRTGCFMFLLVALQERSLPSVPLPACRSRRL